ncbi:MAG: hypothetical protein R3185_07535, partial [Candidatus Thermoplasmatota archaeon]|nr:hypothetical protein [Candidatus Thermoplasmatota archaeon]
MKTKPQDLEKAAIDLAIDKSMEDIQTLLRWVVESDDPGEAMRHIRRAKELLDEMEGNLSRLQG